MGSAREKVEEECEIDEDVQCGFWIFKGDFLQRFASKKPYILIFGIVGLIFGSTQSYFYGTLTTVEKSIQISSKNAGIIMAGSDLSFVLSSTFLTYYAAKGHKPRWIAFGILSMAISCFVNALPHFLFGPTEDSFADLRYSRNNDSSSAFLKQGNNLCMKDRELQDCATDVGNIPPQICMFIGSFFSGLGSSLYFALGLSYLDDNVSKDKIPFLSSLTAFMRRLGPMLGFALASLCLKYFVLLDFNPDIKTTDPRWVGAWWMGWLIIGAVLLVITPIFACFPKMLPRAAERQRLRIINDGEINSSFRDMMVTFKRLLSNKTYVFNNAAGIFYYFGYIPFYLFQSKYIEIQYRLTPSQANMVTGSVSLVFSALGVLIAGAVITKIKPSARHLAAWNVLSSLVSVIGILSYTLFGCSALNNASIVNNSNQLSTCNDNCHCDFVKYNPICGNNGETYISPCHAGCKDEFKLSNGTLLYTECSCIRDTYNTTSLLTTTNNFTSNYGDASYPTLGTALSGVCPVDCMNAFYLFLIVLCINKFISGTESTANFLIGMRCVEERDKSISFGLSMAIGTLFSFLPSPIVFGAIIDKTCVLWGQTCSRKGNCWLYDGEKLRYTMNYTAAAFVFIGTILDLGTWYYSKNFKVFDDEKDEENKTSEKEKELVALTKVKEEK